MQKIFSKQVVADRKTALREVIGAAKGRGVRPKLLAVLCAQDPAAASYIGVKRKHSEEVGVEFEGADLSDARSFAEARDRMKRLCARRDVHGVILVMASAPQFDELALTNLIPPEKDVDGLSAYNLGFLVQHAPGQKFVPPATPQACIMLAETQLALKGAEVVVIGRGRTVGKPLANMLVSMGATITVCHSGTRDIAKISRRADVVFLATGRPRHFGADYFRDGQVIVDAGIGFIDGKLFGDVDIAALEGLDVRVTPVPGGVGALTSVLILENLLRLIDIRAGDMNRLKFARR